MNAKSLVLSLATASLLLGSASAEARTCKRMSKTQGTVVGAVGGGLLGNIIAGRGNRTTGTLIGAAAGGVAGHEISKKNLRHCGRRA